MNITPELQTWFTGAELLESQPSLYEVDVWLHPDFMQALQLSKRSAEIGYQFLGPSGVLFQSATQAHFVAGKKTHSLALPNPNRVSARSIRLYLAR